MNYDEDIVIVVHVYTRRKHLPQFHQNWMKNKAHLMLNQLRFYSGHYVVPINEMNNFVWQY